MLVARFPGHGFPLSLGSSVFPLVADAFLQRARAESDREVGKARGTFDFVAPFARASIFGFLKKFVEGNTCKISEAK